MREAEFEFLAEILLDGNKWDTEKVSGEQSAVSSRAGTGCESGHPLNRYYVVIMLLLEHLA